MISSQKSVDKDKAQRIIKKFLENPQDQRNKEEFFNFIREITPGYLEKASKLEDADGTFAYLIEELAELVPQMHLSENTPNLFDDLRMESIAQVALIQSAVASMTNDSQVVEVGTSQITSTNLSKGTSYDSKLAQDRNSAIRKEIAEKYNIPSDTIVYFIELDNKIFVILNSKQPVNLPVVDLEKAKQELMKKYDQNSILTILNVMAELLNNNLKMQKLSEAQSLAITIAENSRNQFINAAKKLANDRDAFEAELTHNFNQLANLVADEILACDLLDEHVQVLEKWINVMDRCYAKKDFHGAYAIFSGIEPFIKLEAARGYLSSQARDALSNFQKLVNKWRKNPEKYQVKDTNVIPPLAVLKQISKDKIKAIKERQENKPKDQKPKNSDPVVTSYDLLRRLQKSPNESRFEKQKKEIEDRQQQERDFLALQQMSEDEYLEATAATIADNSRRLKQEDMQRNSQQLANFVTDQILQQQDLTERAETMEKWVRIMQSCRDKNDNHGAFAIFKGIKYLAELKGTYNGLSTDAQLKLSLSPYQDLGGKLCPPQQANDNRLSGDKATNKNAVCNTELLKRIHRTSVEPNKLWAQKINLYKKDENTLWSRFTNAYNNSVFVKAISFLSLGLVPLFVMIADGLRSSDPKKTAKVTPEAQVVKPDKAVKVPKKKLENGHPASSAIVIPKVTNGARVTNGMVDPSIAETPSPTSTDSNRSSRSSIDSNNSSPRSPHDRTSVGSSNRSSEPSSPKNSDEESPRPRSRSVLGDEPPESPRPRSRSV